MYTRLENKMTKRYFKEILNDALVQAENEYKINPNNALSQSFFNQLKDIKKTVIEQNLVYTEEEAYKRYPMSVMAMRNFDDDERDYPKKISDIVWGISYYPQMQEE